MIIIKVSPLSGNMQKTKTSQMLGSVSILLAKIHVTKGEPQLYSYLEGKVVYTCEVYSSPGTWDPYSEYKKVLSVLQSCGLMMCTQ